MKREISVKYRWVSYIFSIRDSISPKTIVQEASYIKLHKMAHEINIRNFNQTCLILNDSLLHL